VLENDYITFKKDIFDNISQMFLKQIRFILEGKEDLSLFVTSKKLNDEYICREKIAHAVLVDREETLTGKKAQVGDRIEFVYVYNFDVNL